MNNHIDNTTNNLYLKRVTQSNCEDPPRGRLAYLSRGPQGYKVEEYISLRYRDDLKEGRDGAHLIALVKLFQTLGPEYEMHFWSIDLLHFGRANSAEVAFLLP